MERSRRSKRLLKSPDGGSSGKKLRSFSPSSAEEHAAPRQLDEDLDKENANNGVLAGADDDEDDGSNEGEMETGTAVVSGEEDDHEEFDAAGGETNEDEEKSVGERGEDNAVDDDVDGDAEEEDDAEGEDLEIDNDVDKEEKDEDEGRDGADAVVSPSSSGGNKKKRPMDSVFTDDYAEVGVITKIFCQDFMCHRKLTVDLNRNINFIHGQNGSGKSAILAAIQICLGASARRTHRAGSLKDMIRKDSGTAPSCAIVRVTLLNRGSDAYRPEEYGDSITVERRIALSGGYNGYRLLDSTGKEKSRLKKDLDNMLDTLNIQVDNPVAVLDQEEAKKFLMGKDEDKYAFFMKATELENIDRKVCTMKNDKEETELTIDRKKDGLQAKVQYVHQLKQQLSECQQLGKLKIKRLKLIAELCWAEYNSTDEGYNEAAETLNTWQAKLQLREKELHGLREAEMNPADELQSKRERIESLLAEAQEQSEARKKLEEDLKEANQPYKNADRELSALKRHIESAKKQHKAAKQKLKEKRDEIIKRESSAESEAARRTIQLQEAEERKSHIEATIDALKEETSKWYNAYEEAEGPAKHAKAEVNEINRKLNYIRSNIQSLRNSSGNSLAVYGRNVPRVAEMVEKARRDGKFRGPVIGPIGASLKVVPGKEEFAEIAETALGRVLDKFIVTNDADSKLLRQIRETARCQQECGVFRVAISARYNIPPPPSGEGLETVASVLAIDNDIVFNCLVDNASIDKKVLGRDKEQTERALLHTAANGVKSIRGNVQEVYFLPKGDRWTVVGGSVAIFSNNRKMQRTIGVDTSVAIAEAERDEKKATEDLAEAKRREAMLEHEHSTAMKNWNLAKRSCSLNMKEVEELTQQIENTRSEIENASSETTFDTSEYEEEVAQTGEKLEDLTKSAQDLQVQLEELESPIREIKAKLDDWSGREDKIHADIEKAEKDLSQIMDTQSQHKNKVEKLEAKLQTYRDAVEKQTEFVVQKEHQRDEVLLVARKTHFTFTQKKAHFEAVQDGEDGSFDLDALQSDEPPTKEELEQIEPQEVSRSSDDCNLRIAKMDAKIEDEGRRRGIRSGGEQEIKLNYLKAKTELQHETDEVAKLEEKVQRFEDDIEDRRQAWKAFRKNLVKKTSLAFGNFIGFTNYSGTLSFDHKECTLQLQVSKNSSEKSQSNDVKALSGGERSYTTMCLLLALGENLETPFRILDEFDVFLDSEVRKLTIKSLIHVAKKMKHRQFIFITPQDLSSVTPDKDLKILKLKPPDRYDRIGGPTQQTLD